jgi:hypothetical protein
MKAQTAPGLEAVGAALVALAHATYDALARWEVEQVPREQAPAEPGPTARAQRWRGQLDELRVQVALAEMELHDASQPSLAAAERSLRTVEEQLVSARRDVGAALTRLRDEVRTRL